MLFQHMKRAESLRSLPASDPGFTEYKAEDARAFGGKFELLVITEQEVVEY